MPPDMNKYTMSIAIKNQIIHAHPVLLFKAAPAPSGCLEALPFIAG